MNTLACYFILFILVFNLVQSYELPSISAAAPQSSAKPFWHSKYNSSLNNPIVAPFYSKISKPISFSLSSFDDVIASKALIYNNTAFFVTKSVNLFSVDLSSFQYTRVNLSQANSALASTPALIAFCNTIAVLDGNSYVQFFRINGLSLSKISQYGPINIYTHPLNVYEDKFYVTRSSSPSGSVNVFSCSGGVSNIYLLNQYEFPTAGVAVSTEGIFVLTNFGAVRNLLNSKWSKTLGLAFSQEPLLYNSKLIVRGLVSSAEYIYALDASSGSILWQKNTPKIVTNVLVYKDKLFFITEDSAIIGLDINNGSLAFKKVLPKSFLLVNSEMISVSDVLIFSALLNNEYVIVYYDISHDLFDYYILDKNLGTPIGISVGDGKLVVTLTKGLQLLPIKAPSTLVVKAIPSDFTYNVVVNGTQYSIQKSSQLKLTYLIPVHSSLKIEIQDKIELNDFLKLKFIGWENVAESEHNKSLVKIHQWGLSEITAYFDYFLLTRLSLDYEILNGNFSAIPDLKINGTSSKERSIFVRQNNYVTFEIYAEPLIRADNIVLVFKSWSDGDLNNERKIRLKAGEFLNLVAFYEISKNSTLILNLIPKDFKDEIMKNLNSSLQTDTPLVWNIKPNSTISFSILNTVITINDTLKLVFKGWYGDYTSNSTNITIVVDKEIYNLTLVFEVQRFYLIEISNVTYYRGAIYSITNHTLFEGWSFEPINYTLLINKIVYINDHERLRLVSYDGIDNIIEDDEKVIASVTKSINKITLVYALEKLTTLTIIVQDRNIAYIYVNETAHNVMELGKDIGIKISIWISDKVSYNILAPEIFRINENKELIFRGFIVDDKIEKSTAIINRNPLKIFLEPTDDLVIKTLYELRDKSQPIIAIALVIVFLAVVLMYATFKRTFIS